MCKEDTNLKLVYFKCTFDEQPAIRPVIIAFQAQHIEGMNHCDQINFSQEEMKLEHH